MTQVFNTKRVLSLLAKYDVAGPRYTSYPTVPAWTTDVSVNDYESRLKSLQSTDKLSLYFHLPFCENLCHFCGCMQVITKDHSRSRSYVDILLKELNQVATLFDGKKRQVSQVHFGGGTPNFLQPQELTEIMNAVRGLFHVQEDAEIAIEMHPRTSTDEFCKNLANLGFNRISLGVQDLDPKVQKLINRHQTYEQTRDMVLFLRQLGFDSFNFDLVYGLPGQTMEGWEKTLSQVSELSPNRLAVYSYAHVPWMRPVQRTFDDADIPQAEMKIRLFERALSHFNRENYRLIGMDHFAAASDELAKAMDEGSIHRNFMGYTTQSDTHQIGFGVSAISYVNGGYFQNAKDLKSYQAAVENENLTTFRGHILTKEDILRRDAITSLMCSGKILVEDNGVILKKMDLKNLQKFVDDDLLKITDKGLEVVNEGFLFLRNMAMVFDEYLDGIRTEAKSPTFSRTV